MLEEQVVDCPYCGEHFISLIDCSSGSIQFTEDCQICCQPIVFNCTVEDGQITHIEFNQEN